MPREAVALVLALGLAAGVVWGLVSLEIWTLDERAAAPLIAPLVVTAIVSVRTGLHPLVVGATISGAAGLLASAALLLLARARGA